MRGFLIKCFLVNFLLSLAGCGFNRPLGFDATEDLGSPISQAGWGNELGGIDAGNPYGMFPIDQAPAGDDFPETCAEDSSIEKDSECLPELIPLGLNEVLASEHITQGEFDIYWEELFINKGFKIIEDQWYFEWSLYYSDNKFDLNNDSHVDWKDLTVVALYRHHHCKYSIGENGNWREVTCPGDFNGDYRVNIRDWEAILNRLD